MPAESVTTIEEAFGFFSLTTDPTATAEPCVSLVIEPPAVVTFFPRRPTVDVFDVKSSTVSIELASRDLIAVRAIWRRPDQDSFLDAPFDLRVEFAFGAVRDPPIRLREFGGGSSARGRSRLES